TLACAMYQLLRSSNERRAFYLQCRIGSSTHKASNRRGQSGIFRRLVMLAHNRAAEHAHAKHVEPSTVEVEQVGMKDRGRDIPGPQDQAEPSQRARSGE